MTEYRREITITPEEYWHVRMGPLDHLNGPASYPFPTLEAATRFAQHHKGIALHREVLIVYPDGRAWNGRGWVDV